MICLSSSSTNKEQILQESFLIKSKANLIEIRTDILDELLEEHIEEFILKISKDLIFTFKDKHLEMIDKVLEQNIQYIDIDYKNKNAKKIIKSKNNTKIILSYHNYEETPHNLEEIYEQLNSLNPDYVKITVKANKLSDNLKILNLLKKHNNLIALCMGNKGHISRILSLAYGSHITYGCFEQDKLGLGQISCNLLKRVYRVDKLSLKTKVFGLLGKPVSESISYLIHNLAFKEENYDAVYINFEADNIQEFKEIMSLLSGFSITMPYKETITKHIELIDNKIKEIGSINTAIKRNNKWHGFNTDYLASKKLLNIYKNKKTLIIGAGGVAKAISQSLKDLNSTITITNRTEDKGILLAKKINASFKKFDQIDYSKIDIIINATPIGMFPKIKESPVERKYLKNIVVFDSVYNPAITQLLSDAQRNHCKTISGLDFFLEQAIEQFKLFTNISPNKDEFETILLENRLR